MLEMEDQEDNMEDLQRKAALLEKELKEVKAKITSNKNSLKASKIKNELETLKPYKITVISTYCEERYVLASTSRKAKEYAAKNFEFTSNPTLDWVVSELEPELMNCNEWDQLSWSGTHSRELNRILCDHQNSGTLSSLFIGDRE